MRSRIPGGGELGWRRMKTFVFDADGVLCVAGPFTAALEREHGIPAERLQPFFRSVFRECVVGTRDLKAELGPRLPGWGWRGSVEEFLQFWFAREDRLCPQVLEGVRTLRKRGHCCLLGTNQEKYRAAYLRQAMGLTGEFDGIFPSCELGHAKPSPGFFSAIEQRTGQPAAQFMLVDDNKANVHGARAADWAALHYRGVADIPQIFREADILVSASARGLV